MPIIELQRSLCARYAADLLESPGHLRVGIARNVRDGVQPLNGLRHPPEGDHTGWYLWAGEDFSDDLDFFVSLHVSHLEDWCPSVLPYLGLAPGWRFLIDDRGYEDVWHDPSLLF